MDFDALTANVAPGGMNNRAEIRVLLCCLFARAGAPVPVRPLAEGLHFGGLANYFECVCAIDDLQNNGSLRPTDETRCEITDAGREAAETLRGDLPVCVLEKGDALVRRILARERYEKENRVTFEPVGNGCRVRCSVLERDLEIMQLSLLMPDRVTANRVRDAFLEDPVGLYSGLVEHLTRSGFSAP